MTEKSCCKLFTLQQLFLSYSVLYVNIFHWFVIYYNITVPFG